MKQPTRIAIPLVAVLLLGAGTASAQSDQAIYACVSRLGTVRLVMASTPCLPQEERRSFPPTGTLSGQLTSCDGPLREQIASVLGHSFTALTDAEGKFKLWYLPSGTYNVTFPGYQVTLGPTVVTAGSDVELESKNVTDVTSNPSHCGECNNACPAANSWPACVDSVCTLGTCYWGFGDCNNDAEDGCETSIYGNDLNNCGACGTVCVTGPNSTPACLGGSCWTNCNSGYGNCNYDPSDGCEINVLSDRMNCGGCGGACMFPEMFCNNGVCDTCNGSYRDCNNSSADGCETNVSTVNNCGACGNVCPSSPNATPACMPSGGPPGPPGGTSYYCGFTCNPGWGNCNAMLPWGTSDGCEANLSSDRLNCGACGNMCLLTQICEDGVCKSSV